MSTRDTDAMSQNPPPGRIPGNHETGVVMRSTIECWRQGDVLIRRVAEIPTEVRPVPRHGGRVILAAGEVTGHHHAIADAGAELFEPVAGRPGLYYLRLDTDAAVTHEEHAPIPLASGVYSVEVQREYTPEAIRNVAD